MNHQVVSRAEFPRLVLLDKEDVSSISDEHKLGYSAIALSPSAFDEAVARKMVVCNSRPEFGNLSHARCVVTGRRALADFERVSWASSIPPGVLQMARQSAWMIACLVGRLKYTLKSGPWIVRDSTGQWAKVEERSELLRILLPRIWNQGLGHAVPASRPIFPGLHRLWVRVLARQLSRSGKQWVIAPTSKLRAGLRGALTSSGASLAVLQPTRGGWSDYSFPSGGGRKGEVRLPVAPLLPSDSRVLQIREALFRHGQIFRDNEVALGWACYEQHFFKAMLVMLGVIYDGRELARLIGASAAMAFEANSWMSASVLDAAGSANIPRVVLNHNSQPPSGCPIADEVLSTLFGQRTCNSLVDVALIWSPWAMQWKNRRRITSAWASIQSVSLDYPRNHVSIHRPGRKFRVLHAGNYQNWSDFFPWVPETADEYLDGMQTLAEVTAGLQDIELTFRVRAKREVDLEVIKRRLNVAPNISICGNEQDFLDQLAGCDLLVSHFSTTVEQALQMGKPVLLWGSTDRYCQFPATDVVPDSKLKSPIYFVREAAALPAMLAGIRKAHLDGVDGGEAWVPYRHPPNTPSLSEWVRRFISEGQQSKWPM